MANGLEFLFHRKMSSSEMLLTESLCVNSGRNEWFAYFCIKVIKLWRSLEVSGCKFCDRQLTCENLLLRFSLQECSIN